MTELDAKKPHERSDAAFCSTNAKRARTQPENHGDDCIASCTYERFRGVRFPHEIQGLTHVLYQIDILLMTHQEAVMEAARSGQVSWLQQLIRGDDECSAAPRALVVAAANGRLECVDALLRGYFTREQGVDQQYWNRHCRPIIREAVQTASGKGDHSILELLLREEFYYFRLNAAIAAWEALDDAAASGNIDVVRLVVEHMKKHRYVTHALPLALSISRGHLSVVDFLLGLDAPFRWDLVEAFAAAVDTGQTALADRILGIYYARAVESDMPLLLKLASRKSPNAVKYLYDRGDNQPQLVSKAFESAATFGDIRMMAFLFSTERVSSGAFNRAFERSATETSPEMLKFLCSKQRATPRSISRAFKASCKSEMAQYLYKTVVVSSAAVIAAFKKAARCGDTSPRYSKDEIAIVKLLHKDDRIPAKVMGEALISAARKNHLELVEMLRDDARISVEMTQEAFIATSSSRETDVMKALYDEQRISVDVIVTTFRQAALRGCLKIMKELLKLLPSDVVHRRGLDTELVARVKLV